MIDDLLIKYKNQKPKNFGNGIREKTYPVSAVIAMLEDQQRQLDDINWGELRKEFFDECTTMTPREESGKKVNLAPHDMFEWFKRKISGKMPEKLQVDGVQGKK